jgi:hypothetical protein
MSPSPSRIALLRELAAPYSPSVWQIRLMNALLDLTDGGRLIEIPRSRRSYPLPPVSRQRFRGSRQKGAALHVIVDDPQARRP